MHMRREKVSGLVFNEYIVIISINICIVSYRVR